MIRTSVFAILVISFLISWFSLPSHSTTSSLDDDSLTSSSSSTVKKKTKSSTPKKEPDEEKKDKKSNPDSDYRVLGKGKRALKILSRKSGGRLPYEKVDQAIGNIEITHKDKPTHITFSGIELSVEEAGSLHNELEKFTNLESIYFDGSEFRFTRDKLKEIFGEFTLKWGTNCRFPR